MKTKTMNSTEIDNVTLQKQEEWTREKQTLEGSLNVAKMQIDENKRMYEALMKAIETRESPANKEEELE